TIDWSVLTKQPGDMDPVPVFSFLGNAQMHPAQLPCWVTHTNEATHALIRSGMDRSPMFTGVIEGVGPRYCPSIEDKVHRFADKESHQIYLEPEGLTTHEVYPNGISTSLPFDVQLGIVRSMRGLEKADIVRPGYAIEYDYFDPQRLQLSLETKDIGGLFFAGQINGTTGYEEAAAQGLLAGLNASRQARNLEAWWPGRHEAYLGVMVDDLVTRGVTEPYRMFTSRAEYRLSLREDNADSRLTAHGRALGLVDDGRWAAFEAKQEAIAIALERLRSTYVHPSRFGRQALEAVFSEEVPNQEALAAILLKRPNVRLAQLATLMPSFGANAMPLDVLQQVETHIKYEGYILRQAEEVARRATQETTALPEDFDYASVRGLSSEVCQRLLAARPQTIGQASRLSGVTPAAISLLLIHLKRQRAREQAVSSAA
ncbi:MAG: tRNA uridine-5-carboxymethylaminomethyl(34) synthesis enzyme MnmG, partial [Burkholderiaceae bacterium]|nr:tRNA uridine-5-carboxymethylaminomethyl(34) synthesis enzyme MnmG [Burkholderiaceae bacterium]